jgi:hypothetical protein
VPSLIAKLVKDKCANGLPLHRQRKELARMGLELPEKTIQSYFAYATDALSPVADCVVSTVLGSPIVGADDTGLKVLEPTAKHGHFRGHLWCFVGTDGTLGSPEASATPSHPVGTPSRFGPGSLRSTAMSNATAMQGMPARSRTTAARASSPSRMPSASDA